MDTTLQEYENGGGNDQFISTMATNLNVEPSLIEITDVREGSVILTLNVGSDGSQPLDDLESQVNSVLQTDLGYPVLSVTNS